MTSLEPRGLNGLGLKDPRLNSLCIMVWYSLFLLQVMVSFCKVWFLFHFSLVRTSLCLPQWSQIWSRELIWLSEHFISEKRLLTFWVTPEVLICLRTTMILIWKRGNLVSEKLKFPHTQLTQIYFFRLRSKQWNYTNNLAQTFKVGLWGQTVLDSIPVSPTC